MNAYHKSSGFSPNSSSACLFLACINVDLSSHASLAVLILITKLSIAVWKYTKVKIDLIKNMNLKWTNKYQVRLLPTLQHTLVIYSFAFYDSKYPCLFSSNNICPNSQISLGAIQHTWARTYLCVAASTLLCRHFTSLSHIQPPIISHQ